MKLSQWHDGSVKPVHVGIYKVRHERINNSSAGWSFWSGYCWLHQKHKKAYCIHYSTHMALYQDKEWRGIVKDKK